MYSQTDIEDAVTNGAITADQAASLRNYVATRNGVPAADEEHLRLVLGFNDIFVFTACLLALAAVGWLGTLLPLGSGPLAQVQVPFAGLFVAAAAWGLSEIFTRKRHMALPSILLTAAFGWGCALFLLLLIAPSMGMDIGGASMIASLCFAAGAGATFLHWKRFRVPVAIATMFGFGLIAILALMATSIGGIDPLMIVLLIAGIGTFLSAMWLDSKDPLRHTEKSDAAFWMHWLAAALIVNSLAQLFGLNSGISSIGGAIGVLVIYALFALVALAVNRKVILIAGLTPLILAIRTLLGEQGSYGGGYRPYAPSPPYNPYGNPYSNPYGSPPPYGDPYASPYGSSAGSIEGTMITITIIGVLLLVLAIYWAPLRRIVVGVLPENLRAKLSPTDTATVEQASTFE
jgi:hypothetical protein